MPFADNWIEALGVVLLAVGVIQNVVYVLQLPTAWLELRRHSQAEDTESSWQTLISDAVLPVSLIMPAYNEGVVIVENVRSLLSLRYPLLEVVIVNDGSTDDTLKRLIDAFALEETWRAYDHRLKHAPIRAVYASSLHPRLLVVDKENGRKADAANAGINLARSPLFCVIDGDSVLEPEALLRSVRPFMDDFSRVVAVGGTIRILNGCRLARGQITHVELPRNFLALVQSLEYMRAFLMSRLAWSHWGMLTIVSGAFGIFRRDIAIEVGGFSHGTVGEDYDLIMKVHKHLRKKRQPYTIRYVPEPVCWTEAPESLKNLGSQRRRWQRGSLEVFWRHRDLFLNPRYGRVGMLAFPYCFLTDVVGPVAEFVSLLLLPIFWIAGALSVEFVLAYFAVFFMFGVFVSVASLILEEMELRRHPRALDLVRLAWAAFAENFGYRQLNNYWRIVGWWEFLRGETNWGEMTRQARPAA